MENKTMFRGGTARGCHGLRLLAMVVLAVCGSVAAGQAASHIGDSAVRALVASGRVTSATASTPFPYAATTAHEMAAPHPPPDTPLKITDEPMVAIPPEQETPEGAMGFPPGQVVHFAKKIEKILADKGARVALLARKGRPQSELPEGMAFTHTAFAVYSEITTADGRKLPGYALYNLYQREKQPDVSDLVVDYPAGFFAGVAELEAGIILLSPNLQQRLLAVITSPTYASLHDPRYSAIANPFTLGRQNCTEFVLDVIQAAMSRTDDIKLIKAREKASFEPQKVHVNLLKLLFGSMFRDDISMSDQPGEPVTATFETIGQYLIRYDKGAEVLIVRPD